MKHYAKIISFANHKGGVGKTTTTASMGSILASKGYKVLLVDLDAQANLTSSLLKKEVTTTIYDGLKSQSSTSLYIYKVREDIRLDMIPADLNLAQADLELAGKMARERILSELLENYKSGGGLLPQERVRLHPHRLPTFPWVAHPECPHGIRLCDYPFGSRSLAI